MVMGRRNEGNSYPEAYIDQNTWLLFLDAKFTEWRKARVLYQETMLEKGSALFYSKKGRTAEP